MLSRLAPFTTAAPEKQALKNGCVISLANGRRQPALLRRHRTACLCIPSFCPCVLDDVCRLGVTEALFFGVIFHTELYSHCGIAAVVFAVASGAALSAQRCSICPKRRARRSDDDSEDYRGR